jgi:hypothetical protein
MRHRQPHHPHGLNEIALKRAAPLLVGAGGNARPTTAAPDIVDQDIDPTGGVSDLLIWYSLFEEAYY